MLHFPWLKDLSQCTVMSIVFFRLFCGVFPWVFHFLFRFFAFPIRWPIIVFSLLSHHSGFPRPFLLKLGLRASWNIFVFSIFFFVSAVLFSRVMALSAELSDFFSLLHQASDQFTEIWGEYCYVGGSPQEVRDFIESQAALESSEGDWIVQELISVALSVLHFGPRTALRGLEGRKAQNFGQKAKEAMAWSKTTFERYKKTIKGLTANSIAASLPELSIAFATQAGIFVAVSAISAYLVEPTVAGSRFGEHLDNAAANLSSYLEATVRGERVRSPAMTAGGAGTPARPASQESVPPKAKAPTAAGVPPVRILQRPGVDDSTG